MCKAYWLGNRGCWRHSHDSGSDSPRAGLPQTHGRPSRQPQVQPKGQGHALSGGSSSFAEFGPVGGDGGGGGASSMTPQPLHRSRNSDGRSQTRWLSGLTKLLSKATTQSLALSPVYSSRLTMWAIGPE